MTTTTAQLRDTYQTQTTEQLLALAETPLNEAEFAVLYDVLGARGVNPKVIVALRMGNKGPVGERERRLASRRARFVAKMIDTWGVLLIGIVVVSALGALSVTLKNMAGGIVVLGWFAYLLMKDGFDGQSLGKRALRIRVVDARTGEPCSFGQSFGRNIAGVIGFDALFALGSRKRRLGDMIANTDVVKAA